MEKIINDKKPIVLHIFNCYLPKTEDWAFDLLSNLENVDNVVFAIHQENSQYFNSSWPITQSKRGPVIRQKWSLQTYSAIDQVKKFSINLKMLTMPSLHQELYQEINRIKPDIIHFHFSDLAAKFIELIESINIPVVVSFYGQDYEYTLRLHLELESKFKRLARCKALFVTEGPHGKASLVKKGFIADQIYILPLGILISQSKSSSKKENGFSLVQIASFTEKKGQIFTVKAFHRIVEKYPDIRLTLVGDERDKSYAKMVKQYVVNNHLDDAITFRSFVDKEELNVLLSNYTVFIHPSCYSEFRDCEGGAPVILYRALNEGLPVISTFHCDIPMVIESGKEGLLVPEKNINQLAGAIEQFYSMTKAEFQSFSNNAREKVQTAFNIKNNSKSFESFYARIISEIQ